ncbi:MAG: hypothetical protein FWH35_10560, partial [Treponema sp.]|nr:hypothetical protein [Treponema sp.]
MRRLSVLILFLVLVSSLPALDSIFIGIEPEINAYSREKVAFGGAFSIGFGLNRHFSLGVKTGFYHNFDTVNTLEALGFFRYNIPIKFPGLYVQAELGAATLFEDGDAYPAFLGGLSAGWRF